VSAFQEAIGMAVACPITTHGGSARRSRNDLEVELPAGLSVKGVVLVHQVRTIDLVARNGQSLAMCPRATLLAVRARLRTILGI
jgi:mRNA-degrading endonuclease toxin of MazEF toxin-antitoxin module